MRLGFAVAIHVDPDVLLVDEVLAVGDEGFTHKCLDKFGEFRRRGKTVLLVTHSLGLVERFCDEALWIDAGLGRRTGDPRRVVGAYMTDVEKSGRAGAGRRRRQGAGACAEGRRRAGRRRSGRRGRRARRHVQGDRGPLGIPRGRDHRRHPPRSTTTSRPRVPLRRAGDHRAGDPGGDADAPTSPSASGSSAPTASAATAPTRGSRT